METITIYELLGMVKDDKAPKKIKIDNDILTLSKTNIIQYNFKRSGQLNWDYYIENYRLDEKVVEILDKDFKLEEKKIPEKITINDNGTIGFSNGEWTARNMDKAFAIKINSIIDYLKSKGE